MLNLLENYSKVWFLFLCLMFHLFQSCLSSARYFQLVNSFDLYIRSFVQQVLFCIPAVGYINII